MSEVDFELMATLVKDTNQQITQLRAEQREGFAALKSHDYAQHKDIMMLESRVVELEDMVERLSRAQGMIGD